MVQWVYSTWHLVNTQLMAAVDSYWASTLKRKSKKPLNQVRIAKKYRVWRLGPRKLSMIVLAAWGEFPTMGGIQGKLGICGGDS